MAKIKVLLDFFCEGHPPPVCLRCSPGLFRHSRGAVSCHTSSMAANPHLALTKNSSPTTLANGRRVAQNRGVQGAAPRSRRARREIPARRNGRNPLSVQSAIRRWRNPRPTAMVPAAAPCGGGRRGPYGSSQARTHPVGADAHIGPHTAPSYSPPGASVCAPYHHILYFAGASAHRYVFAPVHWTATPGTAGTMWASSPTNMDELLRVVCGACTSSNTARHKAAVHHPLTGWGRRPCGIRRGNCAICGWRYGRLGISRRARRGCFAGCGQREFRPLRRATKGSAFGNRDFLKKIE